MVGSLMLTGAHRWTRSSRTQVHTETSISFPFLTLSLPHGHTLPPASPTHIKSNVPHPPVPPHFTTLHSTPPRSAKSAGFVPRNRSYSVTEKSPHERRLIRLSFTSFVVTFGLCYTKMSNKFTKSFNVLLNSYIFFSSHLKFQPLLSTVGSSSLI